jgi:hypothetical protein
VPSSLLKNKKIMETITVGKDGDAIPAGRLVQGISVLPDTGMQASPSGPAPLGSEGAQSKL